VKKKDVTTTVGYPPLRFAYDGFTDTLTIEGVKYAGAYFRHLAFQPVGAVLQIIERKEGKLVLRDLGPLNIPPPAEKA